MHARIISVVSSGLMFMALIGAVQTTAQTNAEIIQRVADEIWNRGNLDAANELFTKDLVNHDPNPGGVTDIEGYKKWVSKWRAAFPDYHIELNDLIVEKDMVCVRYTVTGTHQGELFGVPASGIQITMKGINIYELDHGKITEVHRSYDLLGVGQQIGYFEPPPEGTFPYSPVHRSKPSDFQWGRPSAETGDSGDPDANKALIVREVEKGWNQGNTSAALALIAPKFVWHSIYPEVTSYEGYAKWLARHIDPDNPTQITIEALIAEGDKVADISSADLGEGMRESGIRISRVADGKIVEMWRNMNVLPLLVAMELFPTFPEFATENREL